MIPSILDDFPDEARLVGRLLTAYGELEYALTDCVSFVTGDRDAALKTLYRVLGEKRRIDIADAMARHHYTKLGIGNDFAMAIGSMQYCRQIRNQYAHCLWHKNEAELGFIHLDEIARSNESLDTAMLRWYDITASLLEEQLKYFEYTESRLIFVAEHGMHLKSSPGTPSPHTAPREPTRPPLHTP